MWPHVAELARRVSGAKDNGEIATRQPASTAPQLTRHANEYDDWRPLNLDQEMDDMELGPSATAPTAIDRLSQVKLYSKRNKENLRRIQTPRSPIASGSFVDSQINAQRVQWSQGTQRRDKSQSKSSQIGYDKPLAPADDEEVGEVSDDEGFEQDQRTVDVQRKRKEVPKSSSRSVIVQSSKRARLHQRSRDAEKSHDPGEDDEPDVTNLMNKVPPSNYREVNQISKNLTRLNPPKPQTRTKWSTLEENHLISLIEEIGCSWTRIKKLDEERDQILVLRDQVGLKDKARNMKFDYLKAGVQLPDNFEHVALNARQKAKLRELGVPDI